ncbi:hypothetical protein D3C76_699700 [compost metagenome]
MTNKDFSFSIKSIRFDEHYQPSEKTRLTTNFANLARGASRQENLRSTLKMIDNRFNALAHWDNPKGDRYAVELDIISVEMGIDAEGVDQALPLIEILKTRLFKRFVNSSTYKAHFDKPPVICLSVSSSKTYHRTDNQHPVLGFEYQQDEYSLTDTYFEKMGLKVRYFMPANSVAPLAFYFSGDLLSDYTNLELISTISTMDTFQKIYRPEIYNANSAAGKCYQPSLQHQDYSLTRIVYDREERSRLAIEQGQFVEEHFIKPHHAMLEQWSANYCC